MYTHVYIYLYIYIHMFSNTLKKVWGCVADKMGIAQITYKTINNALLINNFFRFVALF